MMVEIQPPSHPTLMDPVWAESFPATLEVLQSVTRAGSIAPSSSRLSAVLPASHFGFFIHQHGHHPMVIHVVKVWTSKEDKEGLLGRVSLLGTTQEGWTG